MFIRFLLICLLFLLNNCVTSSSAFLGPIFTGARTGSVYQASLSYGSGRIINQLSPNRILFNDRKQINIENYRSFNIALPDIPYIDKNPIILSSYKVDKVYFSELIEPEPIP